MLPINYDAFFRDRLVIITGVGRSGTTILGKVLGSMMPVYYLFEPVIMRYFPKYVVLANEFKGILFEDYFLSLIQGRKINPRKEDDSYCGNYHNESRPEWSRSRVGTIELLEFSRKCYFSHLYVIKIPEFQPYFDNAKLIFSGVHFIHIIRDGNACIGSAVERGWYTDKFMKEGMLEHTNCEGAPWFMDEESQRYWPIWNQETRCAAIWRCCIEKGRLDDTDRGYTIRYEEFIEKPEEFANTMKYLYGVEPTEITERHIRMIKEHKAKQWPSIINKIQKPEQEKFAELMTRLGYVV